MPTVPPPGGNVTSREKQYAYYAGYLARLPGTYKGSYKQYDGLTWDALYLEIANIVPTADPHKLANAVFSLEVTQKLGQDISGPTLGKFLTTAGKAIPQGLKDTRGLSAVSDIPDPLSGVDAIGHFFNNLGNANTWIRVAKVTIGGALLIVGIAKLTGVEKGIVGKAVKAAPLL